MIRAASINVFSSQKFVANISIRSSLVEKISSCRRGSREFTNSLKKRSAISEESRESGVYRGDDYEELVTLSSTFVDKSMFIDEVIRSSDKVTLITMPRRWGKSINLKMLKNFLEIQVDENGNEIENINETINFKLFSGGTIQTKPGRAESTVTIRRSKLIERIPSRLEDLGENPVIFMDMKSCEVRVQMR